MQSKSIPFVKQQDNSDCGVACLFSVIKYYRGNSSLEKLRELSGTNTTGTTILGLYQCAKKLGFDADAFEMDIENLKAFTEPCILHVSIEKFQHYVVCYQYISSTNSKGYFLIGDPAEGIIKLPVSELDNIWKTRIALKLSINSDFVFEKQQATEKWVWFKQLIKEDVNVLILTMALGILATLLSLANAIYVQNLIDYILPQGNKFDLIFTLIYLFLILLFRAFLGFLRQKFLLLQSKNFNNRIVGNFFGSLSLLPKSFFDTRKTGDMISRMNDASRIQKNIAYISGSVFVDLVIVVSTSAFLFNYSSRLAFITFGFIPFIVWVILSFTKSIKKTQKEALVAKASNESNYIDIITGIMVIKQFGYEAVFTDKIKKIYNNFQNKLLQLGKLGNRFSITTDVLSVVLSVVLITTSSFMVLNKQLKIGEMMAVISLSATLLPAVGRLSQINLQLQELKIAFDRMFDFSSIKPEYIHQNEISPIVFEKLIVNKISFRFPGRNTVLDEISFCLSKGEMIALLGESGCGKSTTMAIIDKFYQPESGNIKVNNQLLEDIYTPSWRSIIASVPQEIKLFNTTLIENIVLDSGKDNIHKTIDFCNKAGFGAYFEKLPFGYNTLVGEEGINLSGGQKQLVALARALFRKPQVLLLDEATSAMDRKTEAFILQLLKRMQKEMAILLITHKVQTAKIADRVYIIEGGRINVSGSPDKLREGNNFFTQLEFDATV